MAMSEQGKSFSILRLLVRATHTSAVYNQFTLPAAHMHNLTLCSYFGTDLDVPKEIKFCQANGSLWGYIRMLRRLLMSNCYDVIHLHTVHVGVLFLLANSITPGSRIARSVFTFHTSYQNLRFRNKLMLILNAAFVRRFVCCSQASLDSLPTFIRRLIGKRLRVIANGVDIDRIDNVIRDVYQVRQQRSSEFILATIGRLIKIKNPLSILKAYECSKGDNSRLIYIGEGPLRPLISEESKKRGIQSQVQLLGMVPREDVYKNLLNSDLYLSCSRIEGLPVSVLEAMACGRPVILSDIEPHRVIADGVDFIPLIKPDNVDGFAREIKRVIAMTAEEREQIGKKCRKLVEERFSLSRMLSKYNDLFEQLDTDSPLVASA